MVAAVEFIDTLPPALLTKDFNEYSALKMWRGINADIKIIFYNWEHLQISNNNVMILKAMRAITINL